MWHHRQQQCKTYNIRLLMSYMSQSASNKLKANNSMTTTIIYQVLIKFNQPIFVVIIGYAESPKGCWSHDVFGCFSTVGWVLGKMSGI